MNEEELLDKIDSLEQRIAALEDASDSDDDTCPECGEKPCVCDKDDTATADDAGTDEEGIIDNDDVEEVEELDFDIPNFMLNNDDFENDETPSEADGGLFDYQPEEEDED